METCELRELTWFATETVLAVMPQQEQALEYLEVPEQAEAYVGVSFVEEDTGVVTVMVLEKNAVRTRVTHI